MSGAFSTLFTRLHDFAAGPFVLAAFLLSGLWFSALTGFFQVTHLRYWLRETIVSLFTKKSVRRSADGQSISQFQAIATAMAASVGTGNIAGVASAIALGGPGAVFWMWISAFLGMMTGFAENVLGYRYRSRNAEGGWTGGAMVYMERGLRCKPLAYAYALFCMLAALGMGNMTQSNSLAQAMEAGFAVPPPVTGGVAAALVGLVLFGGLKRIAGVTEKLVPVMVALYLLGSVICLTVRAEALPGAVGLIFSEAFSFRSAAGGAAGYGLMTALRMGVSRGVFSNEAGLGSSVMVHAASDVKSPMAIGMWSMFEIFMDTIVMCTVTALVILTSGVYDMGQYLQNLAAGMPVTEGAVLTANAMAATLGPAGTAFIAVALAAFAFATMLGWSYYGERAYNYLFGERGLMLYRIAFTALAAAGAVGSLGFIWSVADIFNACMALPNLLAVVLLSGKVRETLENRAAP